MKTITNIKSKSLDYLLEKIEKNPFNLKYIPKDHRSFYRLAEAAVRINGSVLQYVDKNYNKYDKLAMLALNSKSAVVLSHISKSHPKYEKFLEIAMNNNPRSVKYISKNHPRYNEWIEKAVKLYKGYFDEDYFKCVALDHPNYDELAKLSIERYAYNIQYVPLDHPNYNNLAKIAVECNARSLKNISSNCSIYEELAEMTVKHAGFRFIPIDHPLYCRMAKKAVEYNALGNISSIKYSCLFAKYNKNNKDFNKLIKTVLAKSGRYIQYVPKDYPYYYSFAKIAINNDPEAIFEIPKDYSKIKELREFAVTKKGDILRYMSQDTPEFDKLAEMAIKNSPFSIYYIPYNYPKFNKLVDIAIKAAKKRPDVLIYNYYNKAEGEILDKIVKEKVKAAILKIKSLPPRDSRGRFIKKNNSSKQTVLKI